MQRAENQVAGQRRLHGDFSGFLIANFADQNGIGVLTQHRSKNAAERQLDVRLDLTLDDPVDVVFDRVLGGDQLGAGIVQFAQGGIERGRLSDRSGR